MLNKISFFLILLAIESTSLALPNKNLSKETARAQGYVATGYVLAAHGKGNVLEFGYKPTQYFSLGLSRKDITFEDENYNKSDAVIDSFFGAVTAPVGSQSTVYYKIGIGKSTATVEKKQSPLDDNSNEIEEPSDFFANEHSVGLAFDFQPIYFDFGFSFSDTSYKKDEEFFSLVFALGFIN